MLYDDTGLAAWSPYGGATRATRSARSTGSFPFAGGTIRKVEVNVADDVYLDAESEFAPAMARD